MIVVLTGEINQAAVHPPIVCGLAGHQIQGVAEYRAGGVQSDQPEPRGTADSFAGLQ
jgi:hypothetical protein